MYHLSGCSHCNDSYNRDPSRPRVHQQKAIAMMESQSTLIPIVIASLVHHVSISCPEKINKFVWSVSQVLLPALLWATPPHSVLSLWRLAMAVTKQWPLLFPSFPYSRIIHGGPLGHGCFKIVEVVTAAALWRIAYPSEALPLRLGPPPSLLSCGMVLILSLGTNFVLSVWSRSRGKQHTEHNGVTDMVKSTMGRTLSTKEHVQLAIMAFLNASAEEMTSRGFWLNEFITRGNAMSFHQANLCQAVSFGVWHYHGIPSGITGVALTTLYGYIMGTLYQHGHGLCLPIVCHSIADYFIFAVIARRK